MADYDLNALRKPAMAGDDPRPAQPRPPMNVYTAMLLLSFLAVSVGCLVLAIDLFTKGLPLRP